MKHRIILCLFLLVFSYPVLADLNSKLLEASLECDIDQVKKLINDGANVNARNQENLTPLMLAVKADGWQDPVPVIQALIKAGADVNARDSQGRSTLMWVVTKEDQTDYFSIISTLIKNGAEINARDNQGDTALMIAIRHGRHKFVKLLLKNKAYPHLKNADGKDAYTLANEYRRTNRQDIGFDLARRVLLVYGDAFIDVSKEKMDDSSFKFISNASFVGRNWTVISYAPDIVVGQIIKKRRTYKAQIVYNDNFIRISWLPEFKMKNTKYLHNLRIDFVRHLNNIDKLKRMVGSTNKN